MTEAGRGKVTAGVSCQEGLLLRRVWHLAGFQLFGYYKHPRENGFFFSFWLFPEGVSLRKRDYWVRGCESLTAPCLARTMGPVPRARAAVFCLPTSSPRLSFITFIYFCLGTLSPPATPHPGNLAPNHSWLCAKLKISH